MPNYGSKKKGLLLSCVAFGLAGLMADSAAAYGQEVASDSNPMGDIIVTAQKREESAQRVPIAIQAVSGTQLQQMGVQNTGDLPTAIPGFQVSSSAINLLYYLRGVGSQRSGTASSAEVATFIDGVYMPFQTTSLQGLSNVVSVEVDKGPQGTLFGRNATGGVIQIKTKDPQFEGAGDISLGYGSYDHAMGSLYLTGPLSDTIAADISLMADSYGNGFGNSLATGEDVFKRRLYSARTKILFNISDGTQLRLSADGSRIYGDAGGIIRPAKGVKIWNQVTNTQMEIPGFYDSNQNTNNYNVAYDYGASASLTSDLGFAQLMSITAYRAYRSRINNDFDGAPQTFLPVVVRQRENQITQELQLSSPTGSDIIWTAGFFFLRQKGYIDPFRFGSPFASFVFLAPPGETYDLYSTTCTRSYAGYAQATATIFADTHLTLGARYTRDTKTINGFATYSGAAAALPGTSGNQKVTFSKPTFRIALDHDFGPTTKLFASFNRGFQAGGYNSNNAGGFAPGILSALEPEDIDAYEIGLKTDLFDRRVRLNVSGFLYDYTNLQQQTYIDGALQTLNAGAARIKGVDLELRYQPSRRLTLGLVGEYLDAKFTDFENAPGYVYPQGFGVGPLIPTPIPNAAGNRLVFAPQLTATFYTSHTLETSVGTFDTGVNIAYNDGYYSDPGNLYKEPAFTVVNVSEEWSPSERFSLSLWVRNLFDEKYDSSVTPLGQVGFIGNTVGAPREIGFTARHRF